MIPAHNASTRQTPPVSSSKNQKENQKDNQKQKEKEKETKSVVKDKEKEKKTSKKATSTSTSGTSDQEKILENELIAAAIAEKNDIRSSMYNSISINLDFTKNGQYPLVDFKI